MLETVDEKKDRTAPLDTLYSFLFETKNSLPLLGCEYCCFTFDTIDFEIRFFKLFLLYVMCYRADTEFFFVGRFRMRCTKYTE